MLDKEGRVPAVRYTLIILFVLLSIFPFIWMVSNSFMSAKNIFADPPRFIPDLLFTGHMWDNYKTVMGVYNFGR